MQPLTIDLIEKIPRDVFRFGEVRQVSQRGEAALRMALSRAVAAGEIIQLKNGLYCFRNGLRSRLVEPLEVGTMLSTNGYATLETALSQSGAIPEAVKRFDFGTTLRAKSFETPVGTFTYIRYPARPFFAGVRWVGLNATCSSFRLATPSRALADMAYTRRLTWQGLEFLVDGLRIEEHSLKAFFKKRELEEVIEAYAAQKRTCGFLHRLKGELFE